jgi:phage tail tape-measure protein
MMSEARDETSETTIARPRRPRVVPEVMKIGASVRLSGGEAARQRRSRTQAAPKSTKPAPRIAAIPRASRAACESQVARMLSGQPSQFSAPNML